MAAQFIPDTVPWIIPKTEADFALLAPAWVKRIPAKPAAAAMLVLALLTGTAQAQRCDASAMMTLILSGSSPDECGQHESRSYGTGSLKPLEPLPPLPPLGTSHCGLAQVQSSNGGWSWQMACR